jgi:hypothetical protein
MSCPKRLASVESVYGIQRDAETVMAAHESANDDQSVQRVDSQAERHAELHVPDSDAHHREERRRQERQEHAGETDRRDDTGLFHSSGASVMGSRLRVTGVTAPSPFLTGVAEVGHWW